MKKTTQEAEQPNRESKEQLIFFCLLFAGADQSQRELTVKCCLTVRAVRAPSAGNEHTIVSIGFWFSFCLVEKSGARFFGQPQSGLNKTKPFSKGRRHR